MDDLAREAIRGPLADSISAAGRIRILEYRRKFVPVWLREDPGAQAVMLELIDDELRRLARPVVFREPRCGEFIIGVAGSERPYRCSLVGLSVARLAIANRMSRPETVRASDFAAPDARRAANAVRNQLRRAVEWIEREADCRALSSLVRCIGVEGGTVRYHPPAGAQQVITDV